MTAQQAFVGLMILLIISYAFVVWKIWRDFSLHHRIGQTIACACALFGPWCLLCFFATVLMLMPFATFSLDTFVRLGSGGVVTAINHDLVVWESQKLQPAVGTGLDSVGHVNLYRGKQLQRLQARCILQTKVSDYNRYLETVRNISVKTDDAERLRDEWTFKQIRRPAVESLEDACTTLTENGLSKEIFEGADTLVLERELSMTLMKEFSTPTVQESAQQAGIAYRVFVSLRPSSLWKEENDRRVATAL